MKRKENIQLAHARNGTYKVYHVAHVSTSLSKSYWQINRRVGKIVYDTIYDEYKFIPSIWYIMFWTVSETRQMTDILSRLNKGERL